MKQGAVVLIDLYLLFDQEILIAHMNDYNFQPVVHSVICESITDFLVRVSWAIEGMFGLDDKGMEEINQQIIHVDISHLNLVREASDEEFRSDK